MSTEKIYSNPSLKYPLTLTEIDSLPLAWKFLEIFKKPFIFPSEYRKHVILTVRARYTPEEFLRLESILNKLFWNLRWCIFPFWLESDGGEKYDRIPDSLLLCRFEEYQGEEQLRSHPFFETVYYRSFINKLILVNKKSKKIIIKKMEGSADIFGKNYFNLFTSNIMYDRQTYESIMMNPQLLTKEDKMIEIPHFYFEFDYPFPNLSFCCYSFHDTDEKLFRIKKMYYHDGDKVDEFWFRLLNNS